MLAALGGRKTRKERGRRKGAGRLVLLTKLFSREGDWPRRLVLGLAPLSCDCADSPTNPPTHNSPPAVHSEWGKLQQTGPLQTVLGTLESIVRCWQARVAHWLGGQVLFTDDLKVGVCVQRPVDCAAPVPVRPLCYRCVSLGSFRTPPVSNALCLHTLQLLGHGTGVPAIEPVTALSATALCAVRSVSSCHVLPYSPRR